MKNVNDPNDERENMLIIFKQNSNIEILMMFR